MTDNRTKIVGSHKKQMQNTKFALNLNMSVTVITVLLLLVGLTSIFPLTAIADNQPPQAVGIIVPVTLIAGSTATSINLSGNFSDPDGDALTYAAQSSDTGVVRVSVINATVIITPVDAGVTTVIVMVQDTSGLTITQDITITVNPAPNRAPVVEETINPLTLTAGDRPTTIDMTDKFSDPDGDPLSYSVVSTDTRVATVSISSSTLTITPVAEGTTTVMIMVQDTAGLTITRNVTVTVNPAPNHAPVIVEAIDPLTLTAGTSATTIDMAAHFSDPNPRRNGERIQFHLNNHPGSRRHHNRYDNSERHSRTHHHPQLHNYGASETQHRAGGGRND